VKKVGKPGNGGSKKKIIESLKKRGRGRVKRKGGSKSGGGGDRAGGSQQEKLTQIMKTCIVELKTDTWKIKTSLRGRF